ncbi:class I SAM-dependent methyltransferase [Streptomyces noursei]|uniref:class I SAM-dependent methyltransferase n=1 Tax=Streptomyces noursei TaxID=1971 RepID=UPI00167743D4|nr:class I SAM-dependent methyltransferase [Streptomyces noursei]MCZ1013782.1 class I SAM-dependent methyltransferase [Streptomyces noursei]GGX33254.1 SAM-dependent methyltransferase [Streptomyces noursei]
MTDAVDHYARLLAEHYTWMLGGDIPAAASGQLELLRKLGVHAEWGTSDASDDARGEAVAVDLGCGPGTQTLALVRLGFAPVVAVDTSAHLLAELTAAHAGTGGAAEALRPLRRDIRGALAEAAPAGSVAAVVCMGDTLPHLPAKADVTELLGDVARALRPGGHFVATYRDLTVALHGTDRFLPVRSSDDRLLTCFLEYVDDDTVLVHDLLHTRSATGWEQRTSSYPKLRIPARWLVEQCGAAGLEVRHDETGPRGMRVLHAVKP